MQLALLLLLLLLLLLRCVLYPSVPATCGTLATQACLPTCSLPARRSFPIAVTDHNTHDYGEAEGLALEIVD